MVAMISKICPCQIDLFQASSPSSIVTLDNVQIAVNTNENAAAASSQSSTNELIRVPTDSITMTTQKGSWLGSAIVKEERKDKIKSAIDPLSDQGSISEDTLFGVLVTMETEFESCTTSEPSPESVSSVE
jgi:hypothetical protein